MSLEFYVPKKGGQKRNKAFKKWIEKLSEEDPRREQIQIILLNQTTKGRIFWENQTEIRRKRSQEERRKVKENIEKTEHWSHELLLSMIGYEENEESDIGRTRESKFPSKEKGITNNPKKRILTYEQYILKKMKLPELLEPMDDEEECLNIHPEETDLEMDVLC